MQFMQVVPGLPFGTMFRALISGYNLTNVKVTGSLPFCHYISVTVLSSVLSTYLSVLVAGSNLAVPASGDAATGERRREKGMEDLSAVSIL